MNPLRRICTLALVLILPAAHADGGLRTVGAGEAPRFVPRAEVYPPERGNLRLGSVLVAGGAPYPGTQFTVLREEPDAFGKTRYQVMAAAGPREHAAFDLSPGRYTVQARNGAVTVEQTVEVPANGILEGQIVLDAGELHLGSVLDAQGSPAEQTWFRVMREDTDAYGRPVRVQVAGNGYGQTASFLLPAGRYLAEASYGDARVEETVDVAAGGITSRALVLNAGRLEAFGTLIEGGEPVAEAVLSVHRRLADGSWTEVSRAENTEAVTFVLPEGEYRVRARLDRAQVDRTVRVEAGETRILELPLQAGELWLYATLAGQSDPLLDAWFDVQPDAPGSPPSAAGEADVRGPAQSVRYVLPAGRYRALAGLGESQGAAGIEVAAGSQQRAAIDLAAARVTLSLLAGPGLAARPYTWFSIYRIERDGDGREWRRRVFNAGYYPQADVVLPAGRYLAFARSDDRRGERAFSLAPGEVKVVPVLAAD